jgi:hypothetical protein
MRIPLFLKILIPVLLLILILVLGFVGWAKQGYEAEAAPLAEARQSQGMIITETAQYIWVKPASVSGKALIFYPGAKVDPHAYLWNLAERTNLQVFITKPRLNMAIFGIHQADLVRKDFPEVTSWYVGGHSLGGAMACFYARENPDLAGLILLGAYCSTDLSEHAGQFLSITGGRDNLTESKTVEDNRKNLPASASMREIPGMNHAQVGDYGSQQGDVPASIGDEEVREALTGIIQQFLIGIR